MLRLVEGWLMRATATDSRSLRGRVLRASLHLVPSKWILPIWIGPLRGSRWTVGAGLSSCWVGVYEWNKQRAFVKQLTVGDVVFDVGAQAGFYTLLAAKLVGPSGHVVAFEPDPGNLLQLGRHIRENRLANVTVVSAAVSDSRGPRRFQRDIGRRLQGRLDARGDIVVETVDLDRLWGDRMVPAPRLIKIDVEGEEVAVVRGARHLLGECKPIVLVATHSTALRFACQRELEACGYVIQPLDLQAETGELIAVHANA